MKNKKVMICGYGSAGQYLVDFLLKDHRLTMLGNITIVSRKDKLDILPRLEISKVAAGISNRYVDIDYYKCDFNDVNRLAEVISITNPDVIVYTGRYASGLKYGAFSYPNDIGYGVWIPMSFPYIYNLMKAVKISGSKAKVINTSFPDGVNPLLKTVGLEPYCGAGNINHLIPRIMRASSEYFDVDINYIDVNLVCGHYVNTYLSKEGSTRGCKYYLKVSDLSTDRVIYSSFQDKEDKYFLSKIKDSSASGTIRNQMIATDCAEIVRYLIDDKSEGTIHIPGLSGRCGGQRYTFCNNTAVDYCGLDQSVVDNINYDSLYHDGVSIGNSHIEFTDYSRKKMHDVFNLEYPKELYIDDIKRFADILRDKLMEVI